MPPVAASVDILVVPAVAFCLYCLLRDAITIGDHTVGMGMPYIVTHFRTASCANTLSEERGKCYGIISVCGLDFEGIVALIA